MLNEEFEATYRTHVEAVFRYTLRAVGNRELAEDITSEVFLELYRHQDNLESGRLPAWLFTVAKNRAMDHWRKFAIEKRYVESAPIPQSCSEETRDLQRWLQDEPALKPIHRACLVLHFVHGMSRAEIAERLATTETKVKGHLQYGLQLLRNSREGTRTLARAT